jgi:hypothetical protein
LRPVGPRVELPYELHDTWSFSPDGRRAAFGAGGQGLGLHLYDVVRMRRLGAVDTGIATEAVGWLEPDRVVALLQSGTINVIEPGARRVIRADRLRTGEAVCFAGRGSATTDRGLLVLLGARPPLAPRVLLIDARGEIRELTLPPGGDWGCSRAGLVYDAERRRAFVISRDSKIAEIDLERMRATYHDVGGAPRPRTAPRHVALLPGGGLLVSGRIGGTFVIDPATWTRRVVDARADAARVVGSTILTYDGVEHARGSAGLTAYDLDGTKRFHVLHGRRVNWVHVAEGRAFAQTARALHAVDLETGRLTSRRLPPRTEIEVLN